MPYWDTSDRFETAVLRSHELVSSAQVWRDGEVILDDLAITGGTITAAESSQVRRTLTMTSSDIDLDPTEVSDALSPFGSELRVFSGVQFAPQDTEMLPVGVFPIQDTTRAGWYDELTIDADDRSRTLADARFLFPRTFTNNTTVTGAIESLVWEVLPDAEVFDLTNSGAKCQLTTFDKERWEAIEALADSIGAEPFFDQAGRLVIRPVPVVDQYTVPVWTVDAGTDTASMIDVATGLSGDQVYNAVVGTSSAVTGLTVVAYQLSGPLRWRQGYARPRFYASAQATTLDQLATSTTAILARSVAFSRQLAPVAVPNSALDVGDALLVVLPDGTQELRILSGFTLPLYLDSMPLTTRVQTDPGTTDNLGDLS